ncbi:MAG TPA: cytochrome C, partial [bacterium]|nr:cytochrome C [bacterium]
MKTLLKVGGILIVILLAAAIAGISYLNMAFPKVSPAENVKIDYTPQRLARGQYITHHVTGCFGCHSDRDWNSFAGPIKEDTLGKGGFCLSKKLMGLPGDFYAKNITPYHLKDWTDGELVRVLRTGV